MTTGRNLNMGRKRNSRNLRRADGEAEIVESNEDYPVIQWFVAWGRRSGGQLHEIGECDDECVLRARMRRFEKDNPGATTLLLYATESPWAKLEEKD